MTDQMPIAELMQIAVAALTAAVTLLVTRLRGSRQPASRNNTSTNVTGILDLQDDGSGRLRHGLRVQAADPIIPKEMVAELQLRPGSVIDGAASGNGGAPTLRWVHAVNRVPWSVAAAAPRFEGLTPVHPCERWRIAPSDEPDVTLRIVDLLTPIGRGQRGLIVTPPRAGRKELLATLARAIGRAGATRVFVLMLGARPEDITRMRGSEAATIEVNGTTFDAEPREHIRAADLTLERARRIAEAGGHAVLMLDSLTMLGRAWNLETPHSGKIISGGVDAAALQKPKRFFGAARCIEGGGSLTILATALIDNGSRMDEVIFEEFKGTGNLELVLDRRMADRRVFPAIDVNKSGTRKDDLLLGENTLKKVRVLRKILNETNLIEAMELLKKHMRVTSSNEEFLNAMNS